MNVLYSRVDEEIESMAKRLAKEDQRSISGEIAWLIRQEYTRRYSQPTLTLASAPVENEKEV